MVIKVLDHISDETKGTVAALVTSAALIDFELLDKLPKGALVSILLLALGALTWFVKRDLKKLGQKDEDILALRDRLIANETEMKLLREELRRLKEHNDGL